MTGAYTVRPEAIIRQPALTMPGNATGSEAACTALTGSQIRALCGLGTTDSPTFGGLTLNGHVLMSPTNTYDIGNGTYDPRTVRAATSVLSPLFNNPAAAATTLGNATYGVTVPGVLTGSKRIVSFSGSGPSLQYHSSDWSAVGFNQYVGDGGSWTTGTTGYSGAWQFRPSTGELSWWRSTASTAGGVNPSVGSVFAIAQSGAATFIGDISMSKTSAQGYIYAYDYVASSYVRFYKQASMNAVLESSNNGIELAAANGYVYAYKYGVQGRFQAYASGGVKYSELTNDNTNGILSTSSGALVLSPATSIVGIGGITSSFPALKRSSTTLAFRLGDDSADASITCAGITASGAIQETYRTSSLDPTVSDIGSGKRQGWYNTTALEFRDWVNVGGTLYKSAAYT